MGTFLEEIAVRIKKHDDEEKKKKALVRPKPFTISDYTVPNFEIPKTRDKKQINELRKVLTFIKVKAQPLRKKNSCTIMPISSTSKDLKKIWSNVNRGREFMKKIGLIETYNDEYRSLGRLSFSKLYKYFYENEVKFLKHCKKNNIEVLDLDDKKPIKKRNIKLDIDENRVKIGKGLYLNKPDSLSCQEFENYLLDIFKKNYPEYEEYKNMVDEINKHYVNFPELAVRFEPSFQWNKDFTRVMKIGFRASNELCNKPKEERPSILKNYGLVLDYDVNGSVPRLNKSMNMGSWYGEDRDMYEIIFHNCYPNEQFTKSARDSMKTLLLRGYFETSTDLLSRDIWNYMDTSGLSKVKVKRELLLLNEAIKEACGPAMYGSEIYYIEGCVYLGVIKDLLDMGHFVWFLYDGIYSSGVMMDELFKALVEGCIKDRFDKFYKEYMGNRGVII